MRLLPPGPRPRSSRSVVIDSDGQIWDTDDHALHLRLGASPGDGFDLPGYLAQSLGWVALSALGNRIVIRLNPLVAVPAAMITLRRFLAARPEASVALVAGGAVQLIGKGAEAEASLARQFASVHPRIGPRFTSNRLELGHLFRDQRKQLLGTLSRGRSLSHRRSVDREAALQLALADPSGRTNVNIAHPSTNGTFHWTTEFLAPKVTFFDDDDRRRLVGVAMKDSPDRDYGSWCSRFYEDVLGTGEPSLDRVQARIHRRFGPPVDTCYLRLVQSYPTADGGWIVLSSTEQITLELVA